MGITKYVYFAVALAFVGTIGFYKITIGNLEAEVALLERSAVVKEFSLDDCKKAIKIQNSAIASMNDVIVEKKEKLDNWKAKPAEIRYNTVYEKIYVYVDKNSTTGKCDELKNVIDGIRLIDFSNL